jgi:hypothetical protein
MPKIPKPTVVEKYADESRVFEFDFSAQPEALAVGVQLVSAIVTATPATGLDIGTPAVAATKDAINVQIGSGSPGVSYLLECAATTALGAILVILGRLKIVEVV